MGMSLTGGRRRSVSAPGLRESRRTLKGGWNRGRDHVMQGLAGQGRDVE